MVLRLLAIGLLFLLAGCAPYAKDIQVKTEIGHNVNIRDYKSYTWKNNVTYLNRSSGAWQSPDIDVAAEIKLVIDRELQDHGLQLNTTKPEITVTFQFATNMQALKVEKDPKSKLGILTNVPDAALIIILTETATKNIIWISKAGAEIQQNSNAELVRKRIDYTITKMFKALK